MTIRRLPKPKKHWSDPEFSQDEVDKYEQSLIDKAIDEAGTPYLRDVIIYLMENRHPDAPLKSAGSRKVWNGGLQILLACQFELEKAKNLDLKAAQILEKYPLWNRLSQLDTKTTNGVTGLIKQRLKGINHPLYPYESGQYLKDPDLLAKALMFEINRLKITTE
jgi:hypothetical protein